VSGHEERAHLRIVRGDPTPEEVAALVAVLAASVGPPAGEAAASAPAPSRWAPPERMLRQPLALTGWWESSLPR
jgi:hypothetical protein